MLPRALLVGFFLFTVALGVRVPTCTLIRSMRLSVENLIHEQPEILPKIVRLGKATHIVGQTTFLMILKAQAIRLAQPT